MEFNGKKENSPLIIGNATIISEKSLYVWSFDFFNIVTDFDINEHKPNIPKDIKQEYFCNWVYVVHPKNSTDFGITRNKLKNKNLNGEILAYQYTECSLDNKVEAIYYGFIPNTNNDVKNVSYHKICRVSGLQNWPRKIYAYLKYYSACPCSFSCIRCMFSNRDNKDIISCIKHINWSEIFLFMGDLNESFKEIIKKPRTCLVCSQCYNCSILPTYCRVHKICKHKFKEVKDSDKLNKPLIKKCRKIK